MMAAIKIDRAHRYPGAGSTPSWRAYVDGLIGEGLIGWGNRVEEALYQLGRPLLGRRQTPRPSATSSSFSNALGRLRSLLLCVRGDLRATDDLMAALGH